MSSLKKGCAYLGSVNKYTTSNNFRIKVNQNTINFFKLVANMVLSIE
jgi:hypothetical protein